MCHDKLLRKHAVRALSMGCPHRRRAWLRTVGKSFAAAARHGAQFVDPVRHLVAERRRHDVLAVRATRHGIGALCSAISAIAVSVSPISRKNCTMHPARHAARRPREEAPIRAAQEWGRRGQDLRRCARPNRMKRAAHTITSAASAGMIPSPACALARATSTSSQAC